MWFGVDTRKSPKRVIDQLNTLEATIGRMNMKEALAIPGQNRELPSYCFENWVFVANIVKTEILPKVAGFVLKTESVFPIG